MLISTPLQRMASWAYHKMPDRVTSPGGLKIQIETLNFLQATADEIDTFRVGLIDLLPACFAPIEGVDQAAQMQHFEAFVGRITDPDQNRFYCTTRLLVDGKRIMGAVCCYARLTHVGADEVELVGGFAGVRPEFRGQRLLHVGINRLVLDYFGHRAFGGPPRYFLGYVMSPLSYLYIARRSAHMYPSPERPEDPFMEALLQKALPRRDADGLVREPVATTSSGSAEAWLEAKRRTPEVSFFLERNPRFTEGYGLPILIRLTGWDLVKTVGRILRIDGARQLKRS